MSHNKLPLAARAVALIGVIGFLIASGLTYADASNGNGNGNATSNGNANPDCNGNGPERSCDEDGDHNQGGRCDGNEGKHGDCDEQSVTDVTVTLVQGSGDINSATGNGTNPDCNESGPERNCGEEDGDHNQGGPCDGNEGNRKKECDEGDDPDSPNPGIELVKSGPAQVHAGDEITYTFEVTNNGDKKLGSVNLTDDQLGLDEDLPDLNVGDSAVVTANGTAPSSGSVTNTAEACGETGNSTVCDTDTHTVTVLDPGIEVRKSANPASVDPGQTVTFTYEVENTGDTPLTDVTVEDDVLGDIGTADSIAAGDTVTFTKEFTPQADSPTENVATACATDGLGEEVCDTDLARIQILLPAGPRGREGTPGSDGSLPSTGFSLLLWMAAGLNLVAAGGAMTLYRRRWQA